MASVEEIKSDDSSSVDNSNSISSAETIKSLINRPKDLKTIALEDTIITRNYADKVKPEHYKYYVLEKDEKFQALSDRFEPGEDDIEIFKGTKHRNRMIYPIEDNYEEFENKHYKDFIKYLKKRKFENLESYEKRFLMRILEGVDWKLKDAHEELNIHLNFLSETLPIILTEPMMELIDSGYYYMHGRDRSLRPIMIVSPKEILGLGLEPHDGIMAIHFVAQYVLNHKMYPGKIENVLTVIDLAHLSFTALPKKWIMIFIKNFNHNYYQINTMMINLNTTWSIRMLWKMSKSFIHPIVRNKTVFSKFNTCSELEDLVHPKQLQQKYGGEADNVTVFWPPYSPSNEYGVDPNKIKPLPKGEQDIERNMNEENEVRDVDQIILEERFRNAQSVSHLESVQSNIDAKNDLQYSDSSSQKKCKCECQCIIF